MGDNTRLLEQKCEVDTPYACCSNMFPCKQCLICQEGTVEFDI